MTNFAEEDMSFRLRLVALTKAGLEKQLVPPKNYQDNRRAAWLVPARNVGPGSSPRRYFNLSAKTWRTLSTLGRMIAAQ